MPHSRTTKDVSRSCHIPRGQNPHRKPALRMQWPGLWMSFEGTLSRYWGVQAEHDPNFARCSVMGLTFQTCHGNKMAV